MKKRFTGNTRLFLGISAAIVIVALLLQLLGMGLNLGIDFTGGSVLEYSVGEDFDVADVNTILAAAGYEDAIATKADPSQASVNLQAQLADTAEETAEEATEETAEAAEETSEAALLSPDKSGIVADGKTDLQIRLVLADEASDMHQCIAEAVTAAVSGAAELSYAQLTYSSIVEKGYDGDFSGGYVLEYSMGGDYDKAAIETAVNDALAAGGFSINDIAFVKYDPEAEAAALAEAAAAKEAAEAAAAEAAETEETAEETEEAAEETVEEEAEEATEETVEEAVEETGENLRIYVDLNDVTTKVRSLLEREMTAKYPNFRFVSIDHVSAIAGRDLLSNALKALLIAFVCMLIYIAIRFDALSGLSALLALVHDVLIMLAFMVFFRAFFQINSPFIAAILTIIGYSINNTIIIFDRIRENAKRPGMTQLPRMEIVETSVSSTLARTVNTSLTTLITLVCLYIFGVESIREFAFPLIVGMLAGTYSSVMLSGQIWAILSDKFGASRKVVTEEPETKAAAEAPAAKKPVKMAYSKKSFKKK